MTALLLLSWQAGRVVSNLSSGRNIRNFIGRSDKAGVDVSGADSLPIRLTFRLLPVVVSKGFQAYR